MASTRIVCVCDDPRLTEEVIGFIEGAGAGAVDAVASVAGLADHKPPDGGVVLIADDLAPEVASSSLAGSLAGSKVILFGRTLSPLGLRSALVLGSRASVEWPAEKEQLRRTIEQAARRPSAGTQGTASCIWAPKGGSGASVLSAHLAAALGRLGAAVTLCDLDVIHGDQRSILGADHEGGIADLLRVVHELTPEAVDGVSYRHELGFRVLFAPDGAGEGGLVKATDAAQLVAGLRSLGGTYVIDAPSGLGETSLALAEESQKIVLVITPDLLSLRRGREAMKMIRSAEIDATRVSVAMNRYASGQVSPSDVEAVMGVAVTDTIRFDARLERSPDRGEIAPGSVGLLESLARRLLGRPAKPKGRRRGLFRR